MLLAVRGELPCTPACGRRPWRTVTNMSGNQNEHQGESFVMQSRRASSLHVSPPQLGGVESPSFLANISPLLKPAALAAQGGRSFDVNAVRAPPAGRDPSWQCCPWG